MQRERILYLDGGVLLNLFATGRADDILRSSAHRCITLDEIASERFLLLNSAASAGGDAHLDEVAFDVSSVTSLNIQAVGRQEHREVVVSLAVLLPDVTARLLAAVYAVEGVVATDDAYVRRVALELIPNIRMIDTPELIKSWETEMAVPLEEVGRAVRGVTTLALFDLSRSHRLFEWWSQRLRDSTS